MDEVKLQTNILSRTSHYFMTNRPLSLLLLAATFIFGLFAFFLTPKQYNPEIQRPAFVVTLQYQGATLDQSVDRVVYELVEKVSSVPGVEDVYTEVSDGSRITTTVIFEVNHDTTQAKIDLLAQIDQHRYLAQGFIKPPHIREINPETIPVLQIVFESSELGVAEVRERVVDLSHTLIDIPNVSDVDVVGGYTPALVIDIDPVKMSAHTISYNDLLNTLRSSQTRFVSSGFTTGKQSIEVAYDGRANSPAEIGSLLLEDRVLVRDVANIYEGASRDRSYVVHVNTQASTTREVIMLAVSKREGSSASDVTTEVREVIETRFNDDTYESISYTVVGDDGVTAQQEIFGLTYNLITSVAIVVLVLLLFLSVRSALVVLVAIPMTLLIVFGLGYIFDQTINRITLFALILSLGLLVDSAIVIVENIYSRLSQARREPRELVVTQAVQEVGVGLVLSTLTSVIVFLPMNYITGMMGPCMGPIAFFVPIALVVSLGIAIVVTPFIALHLIKDNEKKFFLAEYVDRGMQHVTNLYVHILEKILAQRVLQKKVLGGALLIFSITLLLPLFGLVHFQMLPKADRDQFYVYIDTPIQTATEATKEFAENVAEVLMNDRDVVTTQVFVAQAPILDFSGMFKGAQNRTNSHQATLRVNLTPQNDRGRSSTDIVTENRLRVREAFPAEYTHIRFAEEPPGPPVQATLVAKVSSYDREDSEQLADTLHQFLGGVEGVVDTYTSKEITTGRTVYTLNQDKAQLFGVAPDSVASTLQLFTGPPQTATEYLASTHSEYTPIVTELSHEYTDAPADVGHMLVTSKYNTQVPLTSVLDTTYEERTPKRHFERAREVIYVTGEVENRSIVYVVIESMKGLLRGDLPAYTVENWNLFSMELRGNDGTLLSIDWGGEWEMTLENFRDLGIAMSIALLLVYTALVAQYNSFSKPAFILVTVPLSLVGILWGFFFLDTFFSIYLTATALIGFIALIGIVVNNAIIYLEYVEQAQKSGMVYEDALLNAGRARLRSILLTSLTTILGSLTIASDPVWSGLAWAIIFGLSLSTLLTLVIYPTLLVYFKNITNR